MTVSDPEVMTAFDPTSDVLFHTSCIVTKPTDELVIAILAEQIVVPVAADQRIIAIAADQLISEAGAEQVSWPAPPMKTSGAPVAGKLLLAAGPMMATWSAN